jgi:DivIVA domain-containing protein
MPPHATVAFGDGRVSSYATVAPEDLRISGGIATTSVGGVRTLGAMAVSYTRPDPTSPSSIAEANFASARKGFDPGEVRDFLRRIAGEMARLREQQQELEAELQRVRRSAPAAPDQLDEATLTRLLGDETASILHAAHESAAQIRSRAEEAAAALLQEATAEAAKVREETELESARRRSEAAELADNEVTQAKDQGRQMVNEARAYRERVLGELTRRRDLARDQIDQLMSHRDRLLGAFVRARDAASEAIGGIDTIEPPTEPPAELVDLTVSTGPVPVVADAPAATGRAGAPTGDDGGSFGARADDTSEEAAAALELDPTTAAQVDSLFAKLHADGSPIEVDERPSDHDGEVDEGPTTAFQQRDAELTPLIVAAGRRLKRVLADEQNGILDTLRQGEPVSSLDALVHDESEQATRYLDAIATQLEAAARAGASSVTAYPDAIDLAHSGALGPVREAVAGGLVDPLRERLAQCVDDADGDNEMMVKRVRAVYRGWKTQHIDTELDDIFRLAYGRGVLAAIPAGSPVTWIVDPHGPACPDAEDNSLAGEVAAGEAFPTGHTCAPAHAGCRCLLAPVTR